MDQKSPHTETWCDMMSANSNPGPCSPSTHLIERGLIFNNGNVVLENKTVFIHKITYFYLLISCADSQRS